MLSDFWVHGSCRLLQTFAISFRLRALATCAADRAHEICLLHTECFLVTVCYKSSASTCAMKVECLQHVHYTRTALATCHLLQVARTSNMSSASDWECLQYVYFSLRAIATRLFFCSAVWNVRFHIRTALPKEDLLQHCLGRWREKRRLTISLHLRKLLLLEQAELAMCRHWPLSSMWSSQGFSWNFCKVYSKR